MGKSRGKLTYANVISTVALFLVLAGGSALAATHLLPKNSVGAKQLKKGAVTPAKFSKSAESKLAGPRGLTGPQGVSGAPGVPGQNLTAETPLPTGKTETGIFSAAGGASPSYLVGTAAFVQPLPAVLNGTHVVQLEEGKTSAPHCPGVGRADPGYFCAYAIEESNVTADGPPEDPGTGESGAGKDGAQFYYEVNGAGTSYVYGVWAVTAP